MLPEPGCFSSGDFILRGWLAFGLDPLSFGWQGHRGPVMGCAGMLQWDVQGCCSGMYRDAVVGCVGMLWLDALCKGTLP